VVVNAVLLGLGVSLLIATARFGTLVAGYQDEFNQQLADLSQHLNATGVSSDQIAHLTDGLDISDLGGVVSAALAGVADPLSGVVFIFALVLFMTMDGSTMPRHLADAARARPGLIGALAEFARVTRRYLLVSTVFGFIVRCWTRSPSRSWESRHPCCGGCSPSSPTTSPTSASSSGWSLRRSSPCWAEPSVC
jgi:AI-2 transport protein TqsA